MILGPFEKTTFFPPDPLIAALREGLSLGGRQSHTQIEQQWGQHRGQQTAVRYTGTKRQESIRELVAPKSQARPQQGRNIQEQRILDHR